MQLMPKASTNICTGEYAVVQHKICTEHKCANYFEVLYCSDQGLILDRAVLLVLWHGCPEIGAWAS